MRDKSLLISKRPRSMNSRPLVSKINIYMNYRRKPFLSEVDEQVGCIDNEWKLIVYELIDLSMNKIMHKI